MKQQRYDAITEIMDILYSLPADYRIGQFVWNSFRSRDMFFDSDKEFIEALKKYREEMFQNYMSEHFS